MAVSGSRFAEPGNRAYQDSHPRFHGKVVRADIGYH